MQQMRSAEEVDELVNIALSYCSELAKFRNAKAEGRLSLEEESTAQQMLLGMDRKIELLKSNNELDRRRGRKERNIIPFARDKRKVAK